MFSFSSTYNITNCINHYKTWDSFPHSAFSHSLTSVIWKIQYQMRSKSHLRFQTITRSVNTLQPIITYSSFSLIKVKQKRGLHFPRVYKWHQESACSSVLLFWFGTRKTSKKKVNAISQLGVNPPPKHVQYREQEIHWRRQSNSNEQLEVWMPSFCLTMLVIVPKTHFSKELLE